MNRSEIIISESVLSSFLAGWNASFEKNGNLQDSEAWKDYMIAMNKK